MADNTNEEIALERIKKAYHTGAKQLNLTQLYLKSIPSDIGMLKRLEVLDISGNNLATLPDEIRNLTELRELNVGGNQRLKTLPSGICRLRKLEKLTLDQNALFDLPDEIGDLVSLVELDLSLNQFKTIPPQIGNLTNLKVLNISRNELADLPAEIEQLKNLEKIYLGRNQFKELPEIVCKLVQLKTLSIGPSPDDTVGPVRAMADIGFRVITHRGGKRFNYIEHIPSKINLLQNLQVLDVSGNSLSILPVEIFSLNNLRILDFSDNNIASLPKNVGDLSGLTELYIAFNNITEFPYQIQQLTNLKKFFILGNPVEQKIPPEILKNYDKPSVIFNYYFSLKKENKRFIDEVKLLVVGQGSVGKTSLIQKTLHNVFDQNQPKTEGILISKFQIPRLHEISRKMAQIRINLWDFGGQEIMHATHQFFLTKRSLYLLVLDSRLTQEENRVEYWLKIIQSFGGESPVLIVGNKIDQHPLDIDRTGLQKKYPNIVGILETSAATGAGIEELKAAIAEQVNNLPHVRDLLPETWFTVKTKLEELGRQSNFITHDKYLELCAENEVSDETSQRTLIGFLHDLGVVLHFQDDPRLEALGILNPQWVTNGVYKILNSHTLFQNKGVLTTSMLDEILNLPEYPRGKRLFIVDMMKKFELCYDIEPDKTFLVPDLLPKDQPDLKFNGVPAFEYAYPVLPSSVITRFIVRMNQKIDDGLVWRTGVVLKIGENKALVKADIEDRKITIAIDGVEYSRRDALSAIRYELGEIHNSIKGLNPQQRVPVPNAPLAEPLKYEYLLKLERAGQETVLVENGNDLITVNVRQMLSAIETEAQRKESATNVTTIYNVNTGGGDFTGRDKSISAGDGGVIVGKDVTGNIISGDDNKITQDSYNKINSADIAPELKDTLLQLGEAVNTMIQKLPTEQAAEVAEDFGKLADEAVKSKPNQKWYSVSIEGLIKAAENLDKLGTPVISLSRKVLSLLTGGVVK